MHTTAIDYSLPNGVIQASAPVEVGHNTGYFWFPSLHQVGDDTLVCAVIRSADIAQGKWPAELFISADAGATWRLDQAIDSYGHTSIRCGQATTLMMPYELWPVGGTRTQWRRQSRIQRGFAGVCLKHRPKE